MMLRERIATMLDVVLENIAVWMGLGMMSFIAWALSRHIGWEDAVGSVFAGLLVLRAIRKRGNA